jgi:hypothetical protein
MPLFVVVRKDVGVPEVGREHQVRGVARGDRELDVVAGVMPASFGPHTRAVAGASLRDAILEMAGAVAWREAGPAALDPEKSQVLREQRGVSVFRYRERWRVQATEPQGVGPLRGETGEVELLDVREPAVATTVPADRPTQ